jgi:hypothetical protein
MESVMKALKALEEEVVSKLSEMYKFDKKEALRRLHEKEEPSIPLPFTGEINKSWCLGMKKSHGLYNQCTGKRINERLCNKCQKEEEKLGKVKEGYIEERLTCDLMDYKDVKSYGSVLEKLKITKEKALEEAARFNVVIPEEQFETKKTQRGRPTKEVKVSTQLKEVVLKQEKKEENTPEGLGDVNPPKKRGRPKKEQKKVVNNCGEELIEALVKEAEKEETEDVFETAKKAKAEAKKKEQAEKKQKEQEKKLELEKKKREEEAKQLEEQKKIEEEEAIKKEEGVRVSATEGNSKFPCDELCEEVVESEEEGVRGNVEFPCEEVESEEEEEITVSKFEFNGKKYLKSSDNILYDPISQDPVGIWNEDDECIDEIEEDDE